MLKDKDSKQSIQVTIRVRPLSEKQKFEDPRVCVFLQQSQSLSLVNAGDTKKFTFDSISYEQSQEQIFERVGRRCTKDCLEGYNCTIFAYGQTGAGKTYTMMGVTSDDEQYQYHRGLIPRTMNYLFDCIDQERAEGVNFIIRCSFLEIYNQQIIDLLNKNNTNLQLREDTRKGVYVEGITELVVGRSDEIMELLHKGSKSRHVGSTFYNETSSRSHSVFTMNIESKYTKNGVMNTKSRSFNFIDLAGSQRTKMSTGERLKQGCNINKSLMNLASVINSLSQVSEGKMQHVNYRNSKLTFLLKDSLGGNSKTNLIANISPSTMFYQETLSTLSFARRAKLIKRQRASINEDSSGNLDSMKNQIKRLKQEVITLMGRLQSQKNLEGTSNSSSSAPQMTSIMHQYVAEEIDKQTRLEMEILKLKERISHLQDGIKHYASSQTHLRMIIAVLDDKITRLKAVQNRLSFNMEDIDTDEERIKAVKEYFEKEREGLIKQVETFRGQSEGTRIVKELLKQAKIMRQDGQQEESLKELLTKNTSFLSMIHSKLQEIAPEKQQIQFNADFEKKVSEIQIEYHKKEEQLVERMEQTGLELAEAQSRNEENEKLLEDAISTQIALQQKVKEACSEKEELEQYLRSEQLRRKGIQQQLNKIVTKNEQIVAQLKNDINNQQIEGNLLRSEVETLKGKIEKMSTNQKYLKEQFDSLEEQKYKLDRLLMQNIEEMKQKKNELTMKDSEISILKQELENVTKQQEQLSQVNKELSSELAEEKKNNKLKIEQLQNVIDKQHLQHAQRQEQLSAIIQKLQAKVKQTEQRLSEQSEEIELLVKQFGEMETSMKKKIESKEAQLKETIALINQKEENGNEIEYNLNQIKAELINIRSEKQNNQTRLNKIIEDLKQKLERERLNYQQLQTQVNERAKIHEELVKEQAQQRNQFNEIKEMKSKLEGQNATMKKQQCQVSSLETKIRKLESENSKIEEEKNKLQQTIKTMKEELRQFQLLNENLNKDLQLQIQELQTELVKKESSISQLSKQYSQLKQDGNQKEKGEQKMSDEIYDLKKTNQSLSGQIMSLGNSLKLMEEENRMLKQKLSNFEASHAKMLDEFDQNAQYKQKWQLQTDQIQTLKDKIQVEEQSKQRLYVEVCKERQNCSNLKLIIENSEAQVRQLAVELEQKDTIYKKLLEKIAKNQNENRKSTNNSENYLKTIELLEKSRSEQLEMRRQNQELKKKNDEQSMYIKEVEKKSEGYCVSMHKRLEEIQKDYFELQRNQEKLIKEKKSLEKCANENDVLKEQLRSMKISANKMVQRQEELESRFKKCNIDYIELEKEFEELKKGQTMANNHDDKINFMNRLKAEVAALKTQKLLLTDSLNKEREEKTKLKAEMRYGKDGAGDLGAKIDLEKKINQNKNLQQLIFEIVSHLKICVNEPRTKLETIRSVILNTIKDKNSEVKSLRERVRQLEDMQEAKHMMVREPALKDYKGFNHSISKRQASEQQKYEKDKDSSVLDNSTRQKMKDFQNYYAKYRQTGKSGKY